jgi:hypothetical protein
MAVWAATRAMAGDGPGRSPVARQVDHREFLRVDRQEFPWAAHPEVRHVRREAHHDCQGRYPRVVRLVPGLPTAQPTR